MPEAISPISGSLFIAVAQYRDDDSPSLFPYMTEEGANEMVKILEGPNFTEFHDVRVAHVMFTEIPDNYNDTDPLV